MPTRDQLLVNNENKQSKPRGASACKNSPTASDARKGPGESNHGDAGKARFHLESDPSFPPDKTPLLACAAVSRTIMTRHDRLPREVSDESRKPPEDAMPTGDGFRGLGRPDS
jgi:hypothetical protein